MSLVTGMPASRAIDAARIAASSSTSSTCSSRAPRIDGRVDLLRLEVQHAGSRSQRTTRSPCASCDQDDRKGVDRVADGELRDIDAAVDQLVAHQLAVVVVAGGADVRRLAVPSPRTCTAWSRSGHRARRRGARCEAWTSGRRASGSPGGDRRSPPSWHRRRRHRTSRYLISSARSPREECEAMSGDFSGRHAFRRLQSVAEVVWWLRLRCGKKMISCGAFTE